MTGATALTDVEVFFVLSDLHMSAGRDPVSGELDRDEVFRRDDDLIAFLDSVSASENRGRVCVILLGDMLDFLAVEPSFRIRPDTRTSTTLRRLDSIAAGHWDVIRAFGRLLRAGGRVCIVAGNHDIELVRHATRHRLATLMVPGPDEHSSAARERLLFSPWFVHVPGILYAEHGSQYCDRASFDAQLEPWIGESGERVRHPVSSALTLLAAEWRAIVRGDRVSRFGPWRTGAASIAAVGRQWSPRRGVRRRVYRAGPVAGFAASAGLPIPVVQEFDRRAEIPRGAVERGFVRDFVAPRLGRPGGGGSVEATRSAARFIHALLAASGHAVAYVLMGHTHHMEHRELAGGGAYLNPGTWCDAPSGGGTDLHERNRGGVAVIVVDHARNTCRASLAMWRNGALTQYEGAVE